jgi:glycosyltransferase involved in cell wall biosynthesis
MRRNWTSHAFGKDSFYKKVMFCLKFLDIQNDYVLFSSAPLFVPLIKKLYPKVFIFDAQDNLLKSALYRNVSNLQNYYNYCVENADLIYTNSPETASWLSTEKITAKFISNGVDLEMFSKNNQYVIPEDLKKFTKPIVGYAGKMQEIFDVELIKELLIKFPKTNFVFIGQILNPRWMKNLWTFPNAHYLGDKKYDLLPAYLHFFDICIVPISQTRQHGGDPIKIYEYIAAGKPVISTNTGGTEKLSIYPQVKVTGTQVEFISELSNFLNSIIEKKEIPFENISIEYTWNYKVNKFIEDISICLRVKDEKV